MKLRWYAVEIRVSTYSDHPEHWNTHESLAIMDCTGYSHFSNQTKPCLSRGGFKRECFIKATSRTAAQKAVKTALGLEFRQGFHVVKALS